MKILAFSDWRIFSPFDVESFIQNYEPDIDLIIYSGDDLANFEPNGFEKLAALTKLKTCLVVAGNDDNIKQKKTIRGKGVFDLYSNPKNIKKISFLGIEGSVQEPGYLIHTEVEIEKHLKKQTKQITNKTKVIVSHTPPYGILDLGIRFGKNNIGSKALLEYVQNNSPTLVVCGHVHSQGGRVQELPNGTKVLNIASHDTEPADRRVAIIELNEKKCEIKLVNLNKLTEYCDLLYLPQFGFKRFQHFRTIGITCLEDFTDAKRDSVLKLPGVSQWHINIWTTAKNAILNDKIFVANPEKYVPLQGNKIFYDIETDIGNKYIFLIGAYNTKTKSYVKFFEKNNEKKLLTKFIKYLNENKDCKLISYSCCRFEKRIISNSLKSHKLTGQNYLENEIDLGLIVQSTLFGKLEGYKVKNIAKTFGYNFESKIDGIEIGLMYSEYLRSKKEQDWNMIQTKNKDDVMGIVTVYDEIIKILEKQTNP